MLFLRIPRLLSQITKCKANQNALYLKRNISILSWWKNKPAESLTEASVNTINTDNFYLPEPPNAPDIIDSLMQYNQLGEATFNSLGLNSNWPTGWVQAGYEALHVTFELQWWTAIALSAVCARLLMTPLTVRLRKLNLAHAEVTPIMAKIEKKSKDAYLINDYMTMMRTAQEHTNLTKEGSYKPYQIMLLSGLQFPIFMSVMMGLRQMAQLPVASLQTGGLFWFTDLTLADPYYILPISTMVLFWLQIEIGADFAANSTSQSPYKKWGIRAIPAVGAIITCNFPSALLLYWWCSSALSLVTVGTMKIPAVKKLFGIKDKVKAVVDVKQNSGVIKEWKQKSAENRIFETVSKIETINNDRWIKAGSGIVPKTFSYDPTKVKSKES